MRTLLLPTLCAVVSAAACTGAAYEPQSEVELPPRVTGVLFVERVEGGNATEVQVGARFLRVVGVRDEALADLVGMPSVPPIGRCVSRGAHGQEAPDAMRADVRLLDVGPLDVQVGERSMRLAPRRFPDLWNVVSGVHYGGEAALPMDTWRFTAAGAPGGEVGAFDVSAQAPSPPASVFVGTTALPAPRGQTITLPTRAPIALRWMPGAPDDRIAVVFEGDGAVSCGARDQGALGLDAATTERVRQVLRDGGTVSVHRLRARPFTAQGLDAATLVFDLSVRARARVE